METEGGRKGSRRLRYQGLINHARGRGVPPKTKPVLISWKDTRCFDLDNVVLWPEVGEEDIGATCLLDTAWLPLCGLRWKKRTPLQKRFLCLDLQLQPYPSFFESKISSRRGAQNKRKIETPRVASFFRLSCDETRTRQSAENWKTLPSPPLLERYSALCLVLKRKTTILRALLGRRALFQTDLRNSLTLRHPHVKNNPQMNKLM